MKSNLSRFVEAQQDTYEAALSELQSGNKRGHWMWFIFPQLRGLGHSETSRYFGIADIAEAEAYLRHPTLGRRLLDCTNTVLGLTDVSANAVFGHPDDLKFISSMTLFCSIPGASDVFHRTLIKFNAGKKDTVTLGLLANAQNEPPHPT
jgi:uncharacterized protein (DUF1810 family)